MTSKTMHAAVLSAFGEPPAYQIFDEPVAADGETLVSVAAASLKQLDRGIAAGTHYSSPRTLPVVCGTDGVGRLADGTPVYFAVDRRPFGAMAERAPASWTVPLPDGLDEALAAAIVNPGLAAWLPLMWRARLSPGETVLVLGATGSAGRMAVRVARLLGAGRVIAAGRRQDVLATLDADATVDLRLPPDALRAAFAEQAALGLDVVVDYVWGPPVEALVAALTHGDLGEAAGGAVRLCTLGQMAGATIALPSAALRGSWLTILGSGTANFPPVDILQAIVGEILETAARGQIGLDVRTVPLAEVAERWTEPADPDLRLVFRP